MGVSDDKRREDIYKVTEMEEHYLLEITFPYWRVYFGRISGEKTFFETWADH
jgi:hypothetical protein